MTPDERAALRATHEEAACEGWPWYPCEFEGDDLDEAERAYAAAACNAVPSLLADVERLEAEIARLTQAVAKESRA